VEIAAFMTPEIVPQTPENELLKEIFLKIVEYNKPVEFHEA